MVSETPWPALEQRISIAVKLPGRRWPSLFSPLRQPALEQFQGTEPSGCSFWRHASADKLFFDVPENHFNCAVGANTHNIPLSPARERETEQTLKMMFDLGYVNPEEVPQIPRLEPTPAAVAYAPLGDAPFTPDAARFACQPAGAMLRNGLAPAHHSPASQLAGNSSWGRRTAAKNRPIHGISLRAHSG
jgi:hypothetical protein